MQDTHLQFLATPSATVANAWIGLVVDRRSSRIMLQTLVAYRERSEARFGARRSWVAFQRALERRLQESA